LKGSRITTTAIDYHPVKPSLGDRVNVRMIAVVVVFSLLVGWPVHNLIKGELNHGIEKVGDHFVVDLKALGNFPFDAVTGTLDNVPPRYRQLDGKRVVLEGFMVVRNDASDDVNKFQLVYNVQICCFRGPPQVQERVFCTVPHGGTTRLYPQNEEIRIYGTLHANADRESPGDRLEMLYTLDVERVEPL
jgi:hypothetical protein